MGNDSFFGANVVGQESWERRGFSDGRFAALESRIAAQSAAFPTAPINGQLFYETDTKTLWAYDTANARWDPLNTPIYAVGVIVGAGSTSSGTYVDYPGPIDLSFTKKATHTALAVVGAATMYSSTGVCRTHKALLINGVDYPVGSFYFNPAGQHMSTPVGARIASGVVAGNYTARLRWRTDSGTINTDNNDVANYTLQETL